MQPTESAAPKRIMSKRSFLAVIVFILVITAFSFAMIFVDAAGNAIDITDSNAAVTTAVETREIATWTMAAAVSQLISAGVAGFAAILLLRQIAATNDALAHARTANEIAGNTSRSSLRAYLTLGVEGRFKPSGSPDGFDVRIENTGKTPVVGGHVSITVEDWTLDDTFVEIGCVGFDLALGPGGVVPIAIMGEDLNQELWRSHVGSGSIIRVFISAHYDTVFGETHIAETAFLRQGTSGVLFTAPGTSKFD